MELLHSFIDFILHIDVHIQELTSVYGAWTYAIFFTIIFCETGLVVAPFLPGDSLLFAAGAVAASGSLDSLWLFAILSAAAILGNTLNYWLGYYVGPIVMRKRSIRFINMQYLDRAHKFFEKHGAKTIVIARFVPIMRTFAPFVAGIGFMTYGRFMTYNVIAGVAWVGLFVFGGYFFGNIPAVKGNFPLVIVAIIVISTIPAVIEFLKHRKKSN